MWVFTTRQPTYEKTNRELTAPRHIGELIDRLPVARRWIDLQLDPNHISDVEVTVQRRLTELFCVTGYQLNYCIGWRHWHTCHSNTIVASSRCLLLPCEQGHREFPFGNSRESRTPKIPGGNSREFLKFLKFWLELRGISRVLSFSNFYCWLWHFSLKFNCLLSKTLNDVVDSTFCVYRFPVYFQILISKNHWTASEFRKLRSLHEWARWDNSNMS